MSLLASEDIKTQGQRRGFFNNIFQGTYVHVLYLLYCVLFYWYLLCSRKANFSVIHRQ